MSLMHDRLKARGLAPQDDDVPRRTKRTPRNEHMARAMSEPHYQAWKRERDARLLRGLLESEDR